MLKSQVNVIQKLECNPLKSHCEHMLSILNSLHTLQEQIQSRFQEYFPSSESKSPPLAVIPSLSSVSSCTIQTLNQTDECSSTLSGTPRGSSLIPDDCSVSASHHQMKAFNLLDATRTAITLVEKLQLCPQKKIILAAIPVNIQLRIQSHRLFLQENLIVLMHTLLHANPKASSSHVMKSTCNDEVVISISLDHFSTSLQNEEVLRTYNSLLPSSSKQLRIEIRDFQSRVSEKDLQELFDQASSEFHKVVSKSSIQYQSKIIDITGFLHRLEALEGRFGFESMGESGGMKVWMAIPYRTESSTVDVPKLSLSTTEKINSILPIKEDHKKNFAKTESKLPHVWIDKLDVLIICESSSAGRDILLLFSSLPHRCTVIYTLEESLELMYQYWNMFHRIFDVIMVDLNFTNVMEWIEDIQRLAKGLPCLPILVAIAEDNSQATTSYITSLGFQSVVTPPLSKEEFEAQVYMKYYENKMKIHAIAKKKLL